MGFCLLNNVAVSAASLTAKGHRVLIVDWDVHHGNGTQAIFWDEPNVLYVSTHQWPLFPGSGRADEVGGPDALGLTVNIPLPPGATGDVVRCALDEVAQPVIDRFAPDWVLVSCGFDAHRADPLGELALSTGDFAQLARLVRAYATRSGRLALFLEGGYNAGALRTSVAATLGTLLDLPTDAEAPTSGGPRPRGRPGREARSRRRYRHTWDGESDRRGPVVSAVTTVAVGYDGSPYSKSALKWAAHLVVQCQARLTVVHAVGLLEHAGLATESSPHRDDAIVIAIDAGLDETAIEWTGGGRGPVLGAAPTGRSTHTR